MSKKKKGFFSRLFSADESEVADKKEQSAEINKRGEGEETANIDEKGQEQAIYEKKGKIKNEKSQNQDNIEIIQADNINDEKHDAGPPETTPQWAQEHISKETEKKPKKKSWLERLTSGLKRSSDNLTSNIGAIFTKKKLDQETLDELEDILIQADLGIDVATSIIDKLAQEKFDKEITIEDVRQILAQEIEKTLLPVAKELKIDANKKPFIILMVGVNGSGKTTSIGKLAQKFSDSGKSVMLAAGDSFRAAAIEQLEIWGKRIGVPVISRQIGADPSGLAYDAVKKAKELKKDVLIIDSAGRLQNREELMAELEKIIRVIKKIEPDAPHAVLLTLDATTGQNALNQVKIFAQRAAVSGLIMTKLDGTARGGILVAISRAFSIPIHYIGVGENIEDLESFNAKDFAKAIVGQPSKSQSTK